MEKRSGVELKRRFNSRVLLAIVYVFVVAAYVVIGLQPANAEGYEVASRITIPEIDLNSDVAEMGMDGGLLLTPDLIVGSYSEAENKVFLVGHSTTVFADLWKVGRGDEIVYDGEKYKVTKIDYLRKSQIKMSRLLKDEKEKTLVLMTCAGELFENGDATHRLILTAKIAK